IMGADGIVVADLTDPPLSTFRQPRHEMGRLGAEMLMRMLDDVPPPPAPLTLMPVELLRRGTTAPPGQSA
ncbi:substrate-binding domain-containing protein, partial [Nostoc sp. NIES-2111]